MKKKILIGICIIFLLAIMSCAWHDNIAREKNRTGTEIQTGMEIKIVDEDITKFTLKEECMLLVINEEHARHICPDDKYYDELWSP